MVSNVNYDSGVPFLSNFLIENVKNRTLLLRAPCRRRSTGPHPRGGMLLLLLCQPWIGATSGHGLFGHMFLKNEQQSEAQKRLKTLKIEYY